MPFAYDNVYGEDSTNRQIYSRSLQNLIGPFLDGQWATCFAYGQTGSGKVRSLNQLIVSDSKSCSYSHHLVPYSPDLHHDGLQYHGNQCWNSEQ